MENKQIETKLKTRETHKINYKSEIKNSKKNEKIIDCSIITF
jgi:hypothetical protein